MGEPAQPDQDQFRFRRAAFYSGLKSKVGLIAAKAAALRVHMNTDSCLIASCVHMNTDSCLIASHAASRRITSSHASLLLHSSLAHHPTRPRG